MSSKHQVELQSSVFHEITEKEKEKTVEVYGVVGVTHMNQGNG